jgi:hypothetical protein
MQHFPSILAPNANEIPTATKKKKKKKKEEKKKVSVILQKLSHIK